MDRRAWMSILVLVLGLAVCGCAAKSPSLLDAGPRAAPYTRVTLLDGRYLPLQEFSGKPTVLMFWSSSCSASRAEIRRLDALAAEKGGSLHFLAVSLDRDLQSVEDSIQGFKLEHLTHAFSGNEAADEAYLAFQQRDIPQIFLIGADGMLKAHVQRVRDLEAALP